MNVITSILCVLLLFVWLCLSVMFLLTVMQGFVYEHKREQREQEYHKKRMESFE